MADTPLPAFKSGITGMGFPTGIVQSAKAVGPRAGAFVQSGPCDFEEHEGIAIRGAARRSGSA